MTKCRGYKYGVEWIARNDEPLEEDVEEVGGLISVMLLADLFGITEGEVAGDVVKARQEEEEQGQ